MTESRRGTSLQTGAQRVKMHGNGRAPGPVVVAPEERLYTLVELAERLRVHPETLRRAIRDGRLRAIVFKGSGGTRIGERALQDWLRELERERRERA